MIKWAIVNPDKTFHEFYGEETDVALNCHEGQAYVNLPNDINSSTHIYDGEFILKPGPNAEELLALAKINKNLELSNSCETQIISNIPSSALGSVHIYPSKLVDQQNLTANVLASLLPNLPDNWVTYHMCADSDGNWAYQPHTASQIQKVGEDMKIFIQTCLIKVNTLRTNIESATTIEQVEAISWV